MITRVICIGSGENHVPRRQRAVCHHPAASRRRQPELDHIAAHQLQLLVGDGVLKRGPEACPVGRVPAAEIEAAVVDQLRGIFWQPEIIVGPRRAARVEQDGVTEDEARAALIQLDPLWGRAVPGRTGADRAAAGGADRCWHRWREPSAAGGGAGRAGARGRVQHEQESGMTVLSATAEDLLAFARGRRFHTILADPPWRFQNRTGQVASEHPATCSL